MQLDLHPAINAMRGKTGQWVFKKVGETAYAASKPKPTLKAPTEGQQRIRDKFVLASDYAKGVVADPQSRAVYEPIAESRGKGVYRVAMNDALGDPAVTEIDVTAYHRQAGDTITIRAIDDCEVTAVQVIITNGQVVESGNAVKSNDALGRWVYTVTANVAAGTPVTVEAIASDRPGNKGSKTETVQ